MAQILLSHSYFLRFDPKQLETGQPYAPLGTMYAAAVLREQGHEVSIFDPMFSESPLGIEEQLSAYPAIFILYDDGFNYLTKMCLTNMREAAFEMIRLAKEKGCYIIVSSSDSTDHYEQYLQAGADCILIGEAEQTLCEVVTQLGDGNKDLAEIHGVAFKNGEVILKTQARKVMRDLDSLPLPAWDLIDIEPYRRSWLQSAGYFSINLATTRGCPYKCNWCAKPIYGNRYHARSPENVVGELELLKEKFGFDHVWFCDDIFGLKPDWVQRFATLVNEKQLKLRFKIQSRADLLVQEKYVEALAAAGCENVWIGAESGSQRILDAMDKGITIEQIREATRLLKAYQIRPSFFIQFGYPGETKDDIRKTIRMINKLLPSEIGISVSYPLPGTVFYERVRQDLEEKSNWTDSDDLALMFRNTYQPSFYKQLHRYVHSDYRKHLAWYSLMQLFSHPFQFRLHMLKKAFSIVYYVPVSLIHRFRLNQLSHA